MLRLIGQGVGERRACERMGVGWSRYRRSLKGNREFRESVRTAQLGFRDDAESMLLTHVFGQHKRLKSGEESPHWAIKPKFAALRFYLQRIDRADLQRRAWKERRIEREGGHKQGFDLAEEAVKAAAIVAQRKAERDGQS